ncbi:MAG: hypothetical protein JWO36_2201 [Myxococcales bacterium]|nr:hypothetical protein [Myxococcales bacterium]
MRLSSLATAFALLGAASAAADDNVANKLSGYESEARSLGTDLPALNQLTGAAGARRLADAEVAYSLGDYDTAALMLFDLASKQGPETEAATYYLAESLYQKGDRGSAHTYFKQVIGTNNVTGKYTQPALERLIELAIFDKDDTDVADYVAALDRSNNQLSSVPYVKAKLAFSRGKIDDAITMFAAVPKGSDYELQALYYTGAAQVANKDLAKATDVFTDLINRKPRTMNDRRMIELGQLALGRLYYEREQPSKSIDSYLLVDRHSDLFPDALYEVAWVYVKGKEYDKALRALELLELSNPQTTNTPTVRILEGNLRVRKAQMIRQSQISGMINASEVSDPAVEYDKAAQIFNETHDRYMPSYDALSQMANGNLNAASFIAQISGRSMHVFQVTAPIPEEAAKWLRDEPDVQRFVSVENDLGGAESNIKETEQLIARLEGVIAANDHSSLYPQVASRRLRIGAILDDVIRMRNQLADQQLRLVDSSGDLAAASAARKQLAQQYEALGNPEQAYADRVGTAHNDFDKIDQDATEVDAVVGSAQAIAVALNTFASSSAATAEQKASVPKALDEAAKEAQSIEDELAAVHQEIQLGKDLAAVKDEGLSHAREIRNQLAIAQAAEQRSLTGAVAASRDRVQSQNLADLSERAGHLVDALQTTEAQIARIVEEGVAQAKIELSKAHGDLDTYKQQLTEYDSESRNVGATVLGASFKDVQAKFYDVIVRSDVGTVDVSWSQKSDTDDDLKRLNLARSRELKQLRDEFHDILDDNTKKPSAPKKVDTLPPPTTEGLGPDKGGVDQRIKPVGDQPTGTQQPAVKPDEKPPATTPKGTTPKTAPKAGGHK